MAASPTPDATLLRDVLGRSTDQALLRVIELIDTLPSRPDRIEQLVSASRARLRTLRPARMLNFGRLLFLPVEGAICAGEAWMPGEPAIPRRTIRPIISSLRDAMGPLAAEIDTALTDRSSAEGETIPQAALRLWSAAARLVPALAWPDADPAGRDEFETVARLCAHVWAQAPLLWPVLGMESGEAPDEAVHQLVEALRPEPASAAVLIMTLIGRSALPGRVATHARAAAPGMRSHVEHALDQWIDRASRAIAEAGELRQGELAEAFAGAIEDMAAQGWLASAKRRRKAQAAVGVVAAAAVPTPPMPEQPMRQSVA